MEFISEMEGKKEENKSMDFFSAETLIRGMCAMAIEGGLCSHNDDQKGSASIMADKSGTTVCGVC